MYCQITLYFVVWQIMVATSYVSDQQQLSQPVVFHARHKLFKLVSAGGTFARRNIFSSTATPPPSQDICWGRQWVRTAQHTKSNVSIINCIHLYLCFITVALNPRRVTSFAREVLAPFYLQIFPWRVHLCDLAISASARSKCAGTEQSLLLRYPMSITIQIGRV